MRQLVVEHVLPKTFPAAQFLVACFPIRLLRND